MNRFLVLALCATWALAGGAALAVDIVWDGGDGDWEKGNWNGGQTAMDVMGRNRGIDVGSGEIGTDVFINSGNVNYDAEILDDFRWRDTTNSGLGTLTMTGGSTLTIDTAPPGDSDGHWSQFNSAALNLDNATLRRTFTPTDPAHPASTILSAGVFSFAGVSGYDNINTQINLTNGGRIENNGIFAFGWYTDTYENTKVVMTINDGSLDLTGADNFDFLGGAAFGYGNADLLIHSGYDADAGTANDEEYVINFTGPGSITVDRSGILMPQKIGPGDGDYDFATLQNNVTYEDLWDAGILQAHGVSGLDGRAFGDFFTVTGTTGTSGPDNPTPDPADDDYTLTSNVFAGDFDASTNVDAHDFAIWQRNDGTAAGLAYWQSNYGSSLPAGGAAAGAIPEPTSALMLVLGLSALGCGRRKVASQR